MQTGGGSMIFMQGKGGPQGGFVMQRGSQQKLCFKRGGLGKFEHGLPPFAPALPPLSINTNAKTLLFQILNCAHAGVLVCRNI